MSDIEKASIHELDDPASPTGEKRLARIQDPNQLGELCALVFSFSCCVLITRSVTGAGAKVKAVENAAFASSTAQTKLRPWSREVCLRQYLIGLPQDCILKLV